MLANWIDGRAMALLESRAPQIERFGLVEQKRQDPRGRQWQILNVFPGGGGYGARDRGADV